jgi:hypothetical protein
MMIGCRGMPSFRGDFLGFSTSMSDRSWQPSPAFGCEAAAHGHEYRHAPVT